MIIYSSRSFAIATALLLSLTAAGCSVSSLPAPNTVSQSSGSDTAQAVDEFPDPAPYAEVLSNYVVGDRNFVDYSGLQANRETLDRYNAAIAAVSPATYEGASEAEQIAYWINAYNSLTLASIIDQNPIKSSIRDIPGVWKGRKHGVITQTKTLDEIEHSTLRVDFNEPRIHAALVCAAVSCPPLRPEPFVAERLDEQLDDQVRQWLSTPNGLRIDREQNRVYISAIFQWFGEDWVPTYGVDSGFTGNEKERAVLNFISQYLSPEDKAYLEAGDYRLQYADYDWALNIE